MFIDEGGERRQNHTPGVHCGLLPSVSSHTGAKQCVSADVSKIGTTGIDGVCRTVPIGIRKCLGRHIALLSWRTVPAKIKALLTWLENFPYVSMICLQTPLKGKLRIWIWISPWCVSQRHIPCVDAATVFA
jgi:hypothetical protein